MKYPYFVASLPLLAMDKFPRLTEEEFLFQARGLISDADFEELQHLLRDEFEACQSGFAAAWVPFETELRHEVAAVRARRLGLDPRTALTYSSGGDAEVNRATVDAFAKTNPMERELQLDQARWRKLDQLAWADPFGLSAVLAFALQLRLAHRWTSLSDEAGARRLDTHLLNVLHQYSAQAGESA